MKFIRMFLFNVFVLVVLAGGSFYPEYMFYVESFSWISVILLFIAAIGPLGSEEIFKKSFEIIKGKNLFYRIVDWIFDFIIAICFMFLQLKCLFVFFLITLVFKMALRIKIKETLQEK